MKITQGDFFIITGECMSCMIPEAEAPDLIGYNNDEGHCYLKKQPIDEREIQQAISVFEVSCCDAQRYRGTNSSIIKRLKKLGFSHLIVNK